MTKPAIFVAPSILSADFARLAEESALMKECGGDWLHVDMMDGHFVPNLTIGPPVVKSLRKHTEMYIDCHLMVSNPGDWVQDLAKSGADGMTFHIESFCSAPYDKDEEGDYVGPTEDEMGNAFELARTIRDAGMKAGIALRPRTPIEAAGRLLEGGYIDLLLIMTVEPGFGGQKFMSSMMEKVQRARKLYPRLHVQVDGGISPKTVNEAYSAGANIFVSGSAIFGSDDPRGVITTLRNGGLTS